MFFFAYYHMTSTSEQTTFLTETEKNPIALIHNHPRPLFAASRATIITSPLKNYLQINSLGSVLIAIFNAPPSAQPLRVSQGNCEKFN